MSDPNCTVSPALFGDSPFDAIRRNDDRGEYWSARDLMPLLGYLRWEDFRNAVDRAKAAAANVGDDVTGLFRGAPKKSGGGRPAEDFRLVRYAAYLVAMNGDPRKPEIAAAQTYFAVKTRQAETAPAPVALPNARQLAELVIAEADRADAAERALAQAAPKVEAHDAFMSADGCYSIGEVAKMLGIGRNTLFVRLRAERIFIDHGDMRNTPYQQYARHFKVTTDTFTDGDGKERVTRKTYARPKGVDFLRKVLKMPADVSRRAAAMPGGHVSAGPHPSGRGLRPLRPRA
ncbi:hypothetical protein Aglo03_25780 [Actinokineospora globicatena]|uniref:Antirepressor protein C-terminal domain-containing protein n=1 Tax=Actinokineospora globicatena TaxID=103729 RepID=A0A9W6QNG6_9PSEU|nr:phage antirepressor KilAC domain-containing protein [Actinokineospora globicatena]GLW91762.1 hypothetical protein Aglo03_25780 [Actinokineospora globicatena]